MIRENRTASLPRAYASGPAAGTSCRSSSELSRLRDAREARLPGLLRVLRLSVHGGHLDLVPREALLADPAGVPDRVLALVHPRLAAAALVRLRRLRRVVRASPRRLVRVAATHFTSAASCRTLEP